MKLSLFSVSYAGLWGQQTLDLPHFIAKAAQLGYSGVMLAGKRPHLSVLDADSATLEVIHDSLVRNRIECVAIAAYTDLAPARAVEAPFLEMQIGYVQALSMAARALGTRVVRVFTAYDYESAGAASIWNGVVVALREMCDRAAGHGVTLAVQNHHDVGVHSSALFELLGDVDRPNCKLGFDAWSPALRGEDLYECAKKLAPHTVMTTNADYLLLPRYRYLPQLINYERLVPDMVRAVRFGTGFIDYPAFFRGLKHGGFDGIANYEICSPIRGGGDAENLDACAAQYIAWMQDNV